MTFEANLAKYGLLDKEHRIYEEKKKQDIDTLFGTSGKSLIIPLGAWDEGGVWGTVTGATTHFGIPNKVYNAIGLQEKETCQGGVLKMTVYNDSETDFLSLRLGKFMVRESEKTYIKEGDPETNFTTNDTLGTDLTRLVNVGLDKNTAKLYKNVKTIAIPPKQLVVLDKSFLAPIYMKSATLQNEWFMYGMRIDFDTKIQIKVEIHKKVYNVNTS
jgi:hypothetical protein